MVSLATLLGGVYVPFQLVPSGSRTVVFRRIYEVFLVLGTLVGVVVVAYMVHKAYKYRATAAREAEQRGEEGRPELGELPSGGGGGRKLFLSFSLSAIIVVSLITWTYFTLLNVENPEPIEGEDTVTVEVVGHQFYWEFVYPNGHSTRGELVVPEDRRVRLVVTSADVFHNFGIPALRAKTDAIPGMQTDTWFVADETGTYQANCYELCGGGHSHMTAEVRVVSQSRYRSWYANTTNESTNASSDEAGNDEVASDEAGNDEVAGNDEAAIDGSVDGATPAAPRAATAWLAAPDRALAEVR